MRLIRLAVGVLAVTLPACAHLPVMLPPAQTARATARLPAAASPGPGAADPQCHDLDWLRGACVLASSVLGAGGLGGELGALTWPGISDRAAFNVHLGAAVALALSYGAESLREYAQARWVESCARPGATVASPAAAEPREVAPPPAPAPPPPPPARQPHVPEF